MHATPTRAETCLPRVVPELSPLDELTERRRRGSRGRNAGGEKRDGDDDDDDGDDGDVGGEGRGKGEAVGERETRRTEGRKKKKRRFRAAAPGSPSLGLSVVKARSLCSIFCASDDARLCVTSSYPLGDAEPNNRGVSAVDAEGS